MLEVALTHRFDPFAVEARFTAPPGVTVLFGPSGAGKTSVMNAVAGVLRPQVGRIRLKGRVLLDTEAGINVPPHRRRLGTVFQDGRLFPHMTVRENLTYGSRFAPTPPPPERFDQVVEMLGIAPLLERRPAALSGGERSRVAIGRALLSAPDAILADEPLAALDEAKRLDILPYFERLRDEFSIPILYVTHSISELARLATTVVVIEGGQVTAQGPAAEVLGDPTVRPMGAADAGALIETRVVAHHADGLSELSAGGHPLFVPRQGVAVGTALRLRIAAQDVMLSRGRLDGISALNMLPATVVGLHGAVTGTVTVVLETPAGRLLSRITARSAEALDLTPGQEVFAVVKSVSVAPKQVPGA